MSLSLSNTQIKGVIEVWNIKVYLDHKFSTDIPLEKLVVLYNFITGDSILVPDFIERLSWVKQKGFI